MITTADESARPLDAPGFADAVTVSWGDPEHDWFGVARIGLAADGGSALAVLFHGIEPLGAYARGALDLPPAADWSSLSVGPLRTTADAPLEHWTVAWDGDDAGFELALDAISAPAEIASAEPVARLGGMAGYEQLVRVRGTVRAGGETAEIDGLGQRGHSWGVADWSSLAQVRTVSGWLGSEHGGFALCSLRPDGVDGHGDDVVWATLVEGGEIVAVADPRLSTTYDGAGHQRRAGLELWATEESGHPVRAAGEVICGSTLELGSLRLDLSFVRWHSQGTTGIGRYDVLRKA